MIRTRENVRIKSLATVKGKESIGLAAKRVIVTEEVITCVNGIGIRPIHGNRFYSITMTKGESEGTSLGEAPTFYEAADFVRTLTQNNPNFQKWVEEEKWSTVVDACRTTQFMLAVHFGTSINLRCGNFNS